LCDGQRMCGETMRATTVKRVRITDGNRLVSPAHCFCALIDLPGPASGCDLKR
jgi:hypothetical protein